MSNKSKKSPPAPPVAYLPNHVLIPSVQHPLSLRGHQLASEATGFGPGFGSGLSSIVAAVMMEQDRKPSPIMTPEELTCRAFHESKGKSPKVLFAFVTGVNPKEEFGLKIPFSLDHRPFIKHRRECKPTSKIMQQEVLRRASLAGVSRMPRPAQWSTEKLQEALTIRFPAKFTKEEKKFLKTACTDLYKQIIKDEAEQEATEKKRIEMEHALSIPDEGGWNSLKAVLRLYHTLVDLSPGFCARKRDATDSVVLNGEVMPVRDPFFWKTAASRYNDKTWIPSSIAIPQLQGFELPMKLPLNVRKVKDTELAGIFGSIKPKLTDLVLEWNKSFSPPEMAREGGLCEQWDYAGFTNRLESRDDVGDHLMYLWEFANENKILGSCFFPMMDEEPTEDMLLIMAARDEGFSMDDVAVPDEEVEVPVKKKNEVLDKGQGEVQSKAQNKAQSKSPSKSSSKAQHKAPSEVQQKAQSNVQNKEQANIQSKGQNKNKGQSNDQGNDQSNERSKLQNMFKPEHFAASQELALQHMRMYNTM